MNVTRINQKIYAGRGKAAQRIGYDFDIYRPVDSDNAFTNWVGNIPAAFNACDNTYAKPNMPGIAYWYADLDGNKTQVGDYLTGNNQIFFIAAMQSLLPIIAVECNRMITIGRGGSDATAVGALPYNGVCAGTMDNLLGKRDASGNLIGWACSILIGGRGDNNTITPMTTKQAGWRILLPSSFTTTINSSDIVTDDLGRRYIVQTAEQTDNLWRIDAIEAHL